MESKIQPLSSGVVTKLRSGISITSVAHCVEELILNSIDAGANCVAIHLNLPLYQIQVIDNGSGIDLDQLNMIGTRYATSKCHTLEDLQNLRSGGFRGEALASLKEVSSVLMIESRAASSRETYCKIFTQGNSLQPKKSISSRPSKGTTVSVYDFMYNMPVRKNSISPALDLEECRKLLQCVGLMHSGVSFTLKNEATGEMCLQLKKSSSLYHTFFQIFGKNKADSLKTVEYQIDDYNLDGCISTDCHLTKDLQFFYVNKRQVLRTKLHKLVNSVLNKALSSKKLKYEINGLTPKSSSPSKTQSQFCIFVLNISCPYDKYDIIFEPRKTMIEFSEWDEVLKLVEETLVSFLKKENLYSYCDRDKLIVSKCTASENVNVLSFDVQDRTQGLFSHVARRLHVASKPHNVSETSVVDKNVVDATPTASDLVQIEENVKSHDRISSIVCLRTDTSETSLLDTLKPTTAKVLTKSKDLTAVCSAPKLLATEFRIPCRSVFPSESPVMLRVPVKSTLSDLQSSCHKSNFFLKLKEKFQYSPKNGKQFSLHKSEHNSSEKISHKSYRHTKLLQNNFSQNSSYLFFNQGKPEAKEYYNESHLNKSSQCPSLSLNNQCKNIESEVNISVLKHTKDKSFQCPSVPSKKAKIVSRFEFRKEPAILPLQHLTRSTGLRRKNAVEVDIAAAESLLTDTSTENEASPVKKIKCNPSFVQRNSYSIYTPSECENIDGGNISDLDVNSKIEALNYLETVPEFQGLTEDHCMSSTSEIFKKTKTKNSRDTNLGYLNTSFNLQPFKESSDETGVMNKNLEFTNFEFRHCYRKETICKQDENPNSSNTYHFQESSSGEISDGNTCVNEKEQKSLSDIKHISNLKRFRYTDAGNLDMDIEIIKKKAYVVNISKSLLNTMSPDSNAVKNSILNTNSDYCAMNNLNKNVYSPSMESIEDARSETLSDITFENKLENVLQESKSRSVNSLALQNTNVDLFSDKIMQGSKSDSSLIKFQYESTNTIQEPKSDEINLFLPPNMPMNKLSPNQSNISELENGDINFESEPFSESLLTEPKEHNTSHDSDNIINTHSVDAVLHVISKNTSFPESSNINEEFAANANEASKQEVHISNYNKPCNDGKKDGNVCDENITKTFDCNEKNNENNDSTLSNTKDEICVDSCHVGNETDAPCTKSDIVDKNKSIQSRWKPHSEPETKRVVYIDTMTGNSTYTIPNAGNSDNWTSDANTGVKKSHFFLTHDYSPFISKTQSPTSKDLHVPLEFQNDLKYFINSNEKYDWSRKWRIQKEDENYGTDTNIECMLNKWDNPMFNVPYEVPCVGGDKISQALPQMYTFLNSYRFSHETLKTLKVIGQVDCKFIACILQNVNTKCSDKKILALFDQHAVHERIRLEELIEDLYETDSSGERSIRTSSVYPHLAISFDSEEIRLLRSYYEKLYQIGIHLKMDGESHVCSIHSVPSCLIDKESNDLRRSRPDSVIILQNSITEWLSSLMKTRSIPQVLPKTLSSVLNSQACRGAVKFGDPLSLEQCQGLLESLSRCKLPFQCAHGRPSIAPILDLNKIHVLYKKRSAPQLWKLSKQL